MRSLSATFLTAQKQQFHLTPSKPRLWKLVLSRSGETTLGYDNSLVQGTSRIRNISETITPDSHKATIVLNNTDKSLTALDFESYQAVISEGFDTAIARTAWAASTAYALDDIVIPTTANGYQYRCAIAGTSAVPPIDVGSPAIDGTGTLGATATAIDLANPANASGTLTSVDVWANENMTGLRVGTFYLVSGTTYKCRASATIGNVTAGSKVTTAVSIAVVAGDFLGCYYATGKIELRASTGTVRYVVGEYIDPADQADFTSVSSANIGMSLYAVNAGANEPTWPTTLGTRVTDGTAPTQITWEMDGKSGVEYSYGPPLKVQAQALHSGRNMLRCILECEGIPDQLTGDTAKVVYTQEAGDTNTVKTLINLVCAASTGLNSTFNGYPVIEVVYDSEDSIIDTFKPADFFSIKVNESRWAVIVKLLEQTGCKQRIGNDGKLHIFVPTITGTSYDYEYKFDVTDEHTFLAKSVRLRSVQPNQVVVRTPVAYTQQYSGSATSATSYALEPKTFTVFRRLVSSAEGTAIAEAMIEHYELEAERGFATVPMNAGQELWDYVKVTDKRQGDTRIGNIQYIQKNVKIPDANSKAGVTFTMAIAFGKPSMLSLLENTISAGGDEAARMSNEQILGMYDDIQNYLIKNEEKQTWLAEYVPKNLDDLSNGTLYSKTLTTQISAGKINLSSECAYAVGYDPTGKEYAIHRGTSAPADTSLLWWDTNTNQMKIYSGTAWVLSTGMWYDKTGVNLDADYGMSLYGGHIALRTFATKATYLTWKDLADIDSLTGVQCYVGTDGKIYAGAGAIYLDASGLHVTAASMLNFRFAELETFYMYPNSDGQLVITGSADGDLILDGRNLLLKDLNEIGIEKDTVGTLYFRTKDIAGTSPISHVFAPSDDGYGYLGDATHYWAGISVSKIVMGNIYTYILGVGSDVYFYSANSAVGAEVLAMKLLHGDTPVLDMTANIQMNNVNDILRMKATNADVTGSRAANGTVYQNAAGQEGGLGIYPVLVTVTIVMAQTQGDSAYVDVATNPPTTVVNSVYNNNAASITGTLSFIVPIGAYYKVSGNGSLNCWTECTIGG